MSRIQRRLLPAAALLLLSSASPASAAGLAFGPAVTPAAAAPTEAPSRTALDAPLTIVEGDTPGSLELKPRPAKGRVVAGTATGIRTAPWQVWLYSENTAGSSMCGGSIVNATTIVTAAHCVEGLTIPGPFDKNGLVAIAGISNFNVFAPTDAPQVRPVKLARSHPSFFKNRMDLAPTGDVAVLTVDPIDLAGPTAKAVALPTSPGPASADGEPLPVGPAARLTGFGDQVAGGEPNGQLYGLETTIVDPDLCPDFPNAVGLCTRAPAGTACTGDSGGGLVSNGVLVGVVSVGDAQCRSGEWALYTNLLAPENLAFVANPAAVPPVAPRETASPKASSSSTQVGGVLTCSGAAFDGGASVKYVITNDQGTRLAAAVAPSITYTQGPGDVGRKLRCRAYGSNAGGVASSGTLESFLPVAAAAAPAATPKPATPSAPAAVKSGLGDMEMYARAPRSVRRNQRFSFKVYLENLPSNVRTVQAITSVRRPGRGSWVTVNVHDTDYEGDTSSAIYKHYAWQGVRFQSKLGTWRVQVDYTVTFTDGTQATDSGVWSIRARR